MPAFSIPLSGLKANSVALNVIGNNLSNLNTTAYKKTQTVFSDIYYQDIGTSGSNSPLQVGFGTHVSSMVTDLSQGNTTSTDSPTDMAINGSGYFVLNNGGTQELTRDGNFSLDPSGNLITSSGLSVMGYPAQDGNVNTNTGLVGLNIPIGSTQVAKATGGFSVTGGLNATAAAGTVFSRPLQMYDSYGETHDVNMTFTKLNATQWSYAFSLPSGDSTGSSGTTGTLTFNSDGTLSTPSADVSGIKFTGMSDGSADLNLTWQLHDSSGSGLLTQGASASSINATTQDGYTSGTYKSFSLDSSGVISALYSNGHSQVVGQVALATVTDASGLTRGGDNVYLPSAASGAINVGVANTGGRGKIVGSALEGSNVDISTEFADLIIAQRSFEANSKTVTAFDTITQDTISMLR